MGCLYGGCLGPASPQITKVHTIRFLSFSPGVLWSVNSARCQRGYYNYFTHKWPSDFSWRNNVFCYNDLSRVNGRHRGPRYIMLLFRSTDTGSRVWLHYRIVEYMPSNTRSATFWYHIIITYQYYNTVSSAFLRAKATGYGGNFNFVSQLMIFLLYMQKQLISLTWFLIFIWKEI